MSRLSCLALFFAVACGGEAAPTDAPADAAAAAPAHAEGGDHAGHDHAEGHGDHDGHKKKGKKGDKEGAEASAHKVFFVSPKDGDTVSSPVKIVMGVEGMEIRPAGELAEGTGHHHVIIGPAGIPQGQVVPKDETHIHFGQGQTEAEVPLPAGEHRITLQFADGNHTSYGEPMAQTITITVK